KLRSIILTGPGSGWHSKCARLLSVGRATLCAEVATRYAAFPTRISSGMDEMDLAAWIAIGDHRSSFAEGSTRRGERTPNIGNSRATQQMASRISGPSCPGNAHSEEYG